MDIEEVAEKTPEKILRENVDPAVGLVGYQALRLAYGLEVDKVDPALVRPAAALIVSLYEAFVGEDCSLVEINPLVLTGDGRAIALDAKVTFDDNALFRHKELASLRDLDEQLDEELLPVVGCYQIDGKFHALGLLAVHANAQEIQEQLGGHGPDQVWT